MNNRLINTLLFIAGSSLLLTGCGEDNSSFETPNKSGTSTNNNLISQNNFTLLFSEGNPKYFDPVTGKFSSVTMDASVQIGDNNNQLITGSRVINFRTEWGLIEPSCTTENGRCSVTWNSGSPDTMPANLLNTIVAYSTGGQESFADTNGNGIFDDGDTFNTALYADMEEPYVDADESGGFTTGDTIIDTINGLDLTGADATHNAGDGLFNGPNCAHSTLCSTTQSTVTVWEDGAMRLNGDVEFTIGGAVSGLTNGDFVILDTTTGSQLTISVDSTYEFTILGGRSYNFTIPDPTKTTTQNCTFTNANASATPTANVTDVDINCI